MGGGGCPGSPPHTHTHTPGEGFTVSTFPSALRCPCGSRGPGSFFIGGYGVSGDSGRLTGRCRDLGPGHGLWAHAGRPVALWLGVTLNTRTEHLTKTQFQSKSQNESFCLCPQPPALEKFQQCRKVTHTARPTKAVLRVAHLVLMPVACCLGFLRGHPGSPAPTEGEAIFSPRAPLLSHLWVLVPLRHGGWGVSGGSVSVISQRC